MGLGFYFDSHFLCQYVQCIWTSFGYSFHVPGSCFMVDARINGELFEFSWLIYMFSWTFPNTDNWATSIILFSFPLHTSLWQEIVIYTNTCNIIFSTITIKSLTTNNIFCFGSRRVVFRDYFWQYHRGKNICHVRICKASISTSASTISPDSRQLLKLTSGFLL